MTIEAIKRLGYIYYMTKWNKELKRETILDIQEMGNYTLVLTENTGLITFHKHTYSEVQDKIYFLNTGVIIREHKKMTNAKISNLTGLETYHKEEYIKAKKRIAEIRLEKERIYNEIQDFFTEDKKILEAHGRLKNLYQRELKPRKPEADFDDGMEEEDGS